MLVLVDHDSSGSCICVILVCVYTAQEVQSFQVSFTHDLKFGQCELSSERNEEKEIL